MRANRQLHLTSVIPTTGLITASSQLDSRHVRTDSSPNRDTSELRRNQMLQRSMMCLTILWLHPASLWSQEGSAITNLGLAGQALEPQFDPSGQWIVFHVSEFSQRQDLNGDGDTFDDRVTHVLDLNTGETTNLGLAGTIFGLSTKWLIVGVPIPTDPSHSSYRFRAHDLEAAETRNLGILHGTSDINWPGIRVSNRWLTFHSSEFQLGEDLNHDGDTEDLVLRAYDFETEQTKVIGEGIVGALSGKWLIFGSVAENPLVYVHNLETAETADLRVRGVLDAGGGWDVFLSDRWLAFSGFPGYVYNRETAEIIDIGPGYIVGLSSNRLVFAASERFRGEDLNSDGDMEDSVPHLLDLGTRETKMLQVDENELRMAGSWLLWTVRENKQGSDFNGDGDTDDWAVFVRDLESGETHNVGASMADIGLLAPGRMYTLEFTERWLVLSIEESREERDLNGDGDDNDTFRLVRDLKTGETRSLPITDLVYGVSARWLAFGVGEAEQGTDLNSDGDTDDYVLHVADLSAYFPSPDFRRGDCNDDGAVDISDAVFGLGSLFLGQGVPICDDACDSNDDGTVDISDAIKTLVVLFLGNGIVPLPGMTECGVDPTDDETNCADYNGCP